MKRFLNTLFIVTSAFFIPAAMIGCQEEGTMEEIGEEIDDEIDDATDDQ